MNEPLCEPPRCSRRNHASSRASYSPYTPGERHVQAVELSAASRRNIPIARFTKPLVGPPRTQHAPSDAHLESARQRRGKGRTPPRRSSRADVAVKS